MIWVRRFLIVPLGLVFFLLLVLTLVIFRVSETFLEPQFYKEQLAKADIYNFVLNDLPTSAIEELRGKDPDFFSDTLEENPLVTTALTTDEIVASIVMSLPPSWVQEQMEQAIDGAGGYITGERDSFQITVTAAERVKAITQQVEALIRKAQLYDLLFDELVTPEIDKVLAEDGSLPFNVSLTSEDLVAAMQEVAPEDWVKNQVDHVLDEMTAYVVGYQETFEINVQLAERADIALVEMKTLLMKASFFELLFDDVMGPVLEENLSLITELPFGVSITQEEVTSALQELVPPAWLDEQALVVIDEAGPYLTGKTDSFQALIPLADRKEVAVAIIEDLALSKLNALVEALPECSIGQLLFQGLEPSLDELPECVPFGIEVETMISLLDIDITSGVREMIVGQIPDQLVYTETDLRQALGGPDSEGTLEILDKVREIISHGWIYTDIDLRADLLSKQGEGSVNRLDDVRAALSGSWRYTDVDLREDLIGGGDQEILDNLDTFRSQLGRARDLRFLVYVLWALLLVAIGVLGGRNLWSKIGWAAVTLGIAAAIVFVASSPIYNSIGQSQIDDQRAAVLQDIESPTQLLMAERGLDVAQTVANDFLAGIGSSSMLLLVVALTVFGISLVGPKLFRQRSSA
jgi:hypothetical protein